MLATRVLALFASAVIVFAACTSSASAPAPVGGGASGPGGVIVQAASSPGFGTVLTGPNGMTLYTHAGDSATSSTCTDACAVAWPPLATTGQPMAGVGVTGPLATLARTGCRPAAARTVHCVASGPRDSDSSHRLALLRREGRPGHSAATLVQVDEVALSPAWV